MPTSINHIHSIDKASQNAGFFYWRIKMEAKEEEFIVTQEWIEKVGAYKDGFQAFKKHFP